MRNKVLIIVENLPAPFDRRVWGEACSLRENGYEVTVLCPRAKGYEEGRQVIDGVRIYRHPMVREGNGFFGYLREYACALFWEFVYAWWIYLRHGFDVIQGCNPPDDVFLVALPFKLLGVKYIFDHHDASPELFFAKYGTKGLLYKIQIWLEHITFRFSDAVMSTNASYRELAIARGGVAPKNVFVVRNGPDLTRFKAVSPNAALKHGKTYLIGYVGNIGDQDGLDILLDVALRIKSLGRVDVHFTCVGSGSGLKSLQRMAHEKGLGDMVTFTGRVSDDEMLEILSTADICVNPDRPCEMNSISTMIKVMEYMALAKPIIQFDLKEGRFSAQDASLYADVDDRVADFAAKIAWLLDNPDARRRMGEYGYRRVAQGLAWEHSVPNLLAAYEAALSPEAESRSAVARTAKPERGRAPSRPLVIFTRAYYAVKPLLPLALSLVARRRRADSRRRAYASVWPIDQAAGATPPGWPGWPEGKRFAFVLTHDVEGNRGLGRVERLMDLEMKHGFRSSFNFVPEGDYRVPEAMRRRLGEAGFEVGIHGLNHDGKLYNSKAKFAGKAAGINGYLREWGACGFRSPSMQHRLEWLHQLDVEYDCSTFDTDPFEPEPDGFGTIFPFWVAGPNGSGYVELPYSLPQDFTLFVLLRERTIDVWKRKLDWVAEHGGMALLDSHPDYMAFDGEPARDEYPASYYEELLRYAREKYDGLFWEATPREVARFYCASVPVAARNTRKKICMLAYSNYEADGRVRRYAEALASRGDRVDVIALSNSSGRLDEVKISGVAVYPIQRRELNERSKWAYAYRLLRFLLASSLFLTRRQHHVRYDLIHVHNVPDFLVFAAWYAKRTGAKLILDIHDIVPELFANKFDSRIDRLYVKLLEAAEKASAAFVDHVIVSNDLWSEKLIARSVPKDKCSVFLNHVDRAIFFPHTRTRGHEKVVIAFPGSFQWHQGLDIAIEALVEVRKQVPNVELHLYGNGRLENELRRLADRLGLNGSVRFCGSVPLDRMPEMMANTDLGVVPKRADGFGNEAYSTKIMEFMSQGVPVIASRTKIDTYYFDDSLVRFFKPGDVHDLAVAMLELIRRKELRDSLSQRGKEYVAHNSWDIRKRDYLDLVDSLSAR